MKHAGLTCTRALACASVVAVGVACDSVAPSVAWAEARGVRTQAIVDGHAVLDASPVLLLRGPTGRCSSTLVAKRLVVTARHCVAQLASGPFSCTPQGETSLDGTSGGRMGEHWPATELGFFRARHAAASLDPNATPDAIGARILSTGTRTACRDDLAFVLLDREILGVAPASLRLDSETTLGERVSVLGYGLTGRDEPTALHARDDVEVLGVGAPRPSQFAGLAPVRALRISSVTCSGDSGGPIFSYATGALIALVSIGAWEQNRADDPYGPCVRDELSAASGPRIGAYAELVQEAFDAANETPVLERQLASAVADAGLDSPHSAPNRVHGCAIAAREPRSPALLAASILLSVARLLSRAHSARRRRVR